MRFLDLSSDIVRLENLEGGHLYGINVPGTGVDFDCRVPGLMQTRGGTYLLLSDGADFTFLASDLGVYGSGEITIVEYQITDEEKALINVINLPDMKDGYLKVSLDINEDTYFCPIISQGDSSKYPGLQLKCSYSDSSFGGRVVFGCESRYMFSQWSLSNGRVLDNGDGHALEHAIIRNGSWMNGQVVIELSTNGFPDVF